MTAVGKSCPIERERDLEHWARKLTVSQAAIPTPAPAIRERSCSLVNQSWGRHLALSPRAIFTFQKSRAGGRHLIKEYDNQTNQWRLGMTVRGGCLCGLIEFEVDLPFVKFVKCHCSRCRRAIGSAFAANAYVLPQAFRWLSGQDHVERFDFPLARSFSTSFCPARGSPLPHAHA
jgi:hypothetical protein